MYEGKTVAAVVPVYNEAEFIGEVIETLPAYLDRTYVIDDASTDGSWAEITSRADELEADGGATGTRLGTDDGETGTRPGTGMDPSSATDEEADGPEIVPIQHDRNRGVGGAIKTGYQRALEDGTDVTVVMAGDGQTEPDIVERIVEPVASGRVDYAKGNRMLTREGMPKFRQVGNFTLALLTKIASGYWKVNDPQNGSTAISWEALDALELEELYEDYGFVNDLLVRLNVHGMRVADVPRRAVYKDEESHIDYKTFVPKLSGLLLRDFLWRLRVKYLQREFHPLALFYYLGAATTLAGTVSAVRERGSDGGNGPVLFVLGWLLMLFAMVFDMEENEPLQEVGRHPDGTGTED